VGAFCEIFWRAARRAEIGSVEGCRTGLDRMGQRPGAQRRTLPSRLPIGESRPGAMRAP